MVDVGVAVDRGWESMEWARRAWLVFIPKGSKGLTVLPRHVCLTHHYNVCAITVIAEAVWPPHRPVPPCTHYPAQTGYGQYGLV